MSSEYEIRPASLAMDSNGNIRVSGISDYRYISRYGTLSNAVDSLPSTGGVVIVEPGTWNIDDSPIELTSNQHIIGFGDSSILHNTDDTYTYKHTISAEGSSGSELTGISIENVKLTGVTGGGNGIYFDYVDDFTLKNITVDGVGTHGIYIYNSDYGFLNNIHITGCQNGLVLNTSTRNVGNNIYCFSNSGNGFQIETGSSYNVFSSIGATSNIDGVYFQSGSTYNLVIGNNNFEGNSSDNVEDNGSNNEWMYDAKYFLVDGSRAMTGDILLGANKLKTTNLLLKESGTTSLSVRDVADTGDLDIYVRSLFSQALKKGGGGKVVVTGGIDTDDDVDFNQNVAIEMVIDSGTSFPVSPSPVNGQIFYRTDEDRAYIYDGSEWDAIGTVLEKIDVTGTWTPSASGWQNFDIQPSAGEVWEISVYARITANGQAGDDLYLQLLTDTVNMNVTIDSSTGVNAQVSTTNGSFLLSNDSYCRIRGNFDSTNEDVSYYYQGWKIS